MGVVVSDCSVLIDLERGALLSATFRLQHTFVVPDILYARELACSNGPQLIDMGLQVMGVADQGVSLAATYRVRQPRLTLPDAFALALAKLGHQDLVSGNSFGSHTLLSGDKALRELAQEEGIECRGLFWILDEIEAAGLLHHDGLLAALSAVSSHSRRRLPAHEITTRLIRYRGSE